MVKLLLAGGLGNQLFQLFFAIHFMFLKGIDERNLFIETDYNFNRDKKYKRKYALDTLGVKLPSKRLTTVQRLMVKKKLRRILGNTYKFWSKGTIVIDDNYDFQFIRKKFNNFDYIIDGYFQNSRYANKQVIEYTRSLTQLDQVQKEHLAIHVRHFDPGGFANPNNLQLNFYVDAFKDLLKNYQPGSIVLIGEDKLAQEELKFCLEELSKLPINISRNPEPIDFELIMNSRYLIGSMSTFCLSAYFLSAGKKPFVRFPTENSSSKSHSWNAHRLGIAEINS